MSGRIESQRDPNRRAEAMDGMLYCDCNIHHNSPIGFGLIFPWWLKYDKFSPLLDSSTSYSAALYEISGILKTGLDRESLKLCVELLESGVNPEALATVVKDMQAKGVQQSTSQSTYVKIDCNSLGK